MRIIAFILMLLFSTQNADGFWPFGAKWLVRINDKTYSKEDFINWWNNYKESRDKLTDDKLEDFINWKLMVQEAQRLKLFNEPSYKHKIRVFLEARSLMLLKEEEINSKIKITEKEIENTYNKLFVPIMYLQIFAFSSKEEALEFIKSKKMKKKYHTISGWFRPIGLKIENPEVIAKAKINELVGPIKQADGYYVYKILDKEYPDRSDFIKLKDDIIDFIRKKKERELTRALIEKLKKKYNVWINREILSKVNFNNIDKYKDQIVLKIDKRTMTAELFMKFLKKEYQWIKKNRFIKASLDQLKERLINTIINQTLVSIEALNRHYEKRPPFKYVFEFYKEHRLIKELENKIIAPKVKITDAEIKEYYQKHKEKFKKPDYVKLAAIESRDLSLLEEAYKRVISGEDFIKVAQDIEKRKIKVEKIPVVHLLPKVQELVYKLKPQEISPPFKIGNVYAIIKIYSIEKGKYLPLEEVKEKIKKELWKIKFQKEKQHFIRMLREKSEIKINKKLWEEIRGGYGK